MSGTPVPLLISLAFHSTAKLPLTLQSRPRPILA